MWFKYFDKASWELRIWRGVNLRFNQDDFGMFRVKYIRRWKDLYFRMARSEANVRGCNIAIFISTIFMFAWFKSYYLEPNFDRPKRLKEQKELEENDAKAKQTLFYNRMGAPTRPIRSLDDLLTFMAGSKTYDDLSDFASYKQSSNINNDQQKGLDSWMSEKDYKIMDYYREMQKHGGSH